MKPFTRLATVVLSLIAILHLIRVVQGWTVSIGGAVIPVWVSGIAFLVIGGLAVMLWLETRAR